MLSPRTDYLRKPFEAQGFDAAAWQVAFARHPQERVRLSLRLVKAFSQGATVAQLSEQYQVHRVTVRRTLRRYLEQGLVGLCAPEQRPRAGRLTAQQQTSFRQTLLSSRPEEHGLQGRIWTGQLMRQYLLTTWQIAYRGGIYDLLERLGLTHQKAHADYGNAEEEAQRASLNALKETLLELPGPVVAFDEFSVCEKPTAAYGWAEKNTRPRFTTNEKKENASTPC